MFYKKTKLKPELEFRLPIFDQKIKFYIGDVEKIAMFLEVNILPPFSAFQWSDAGVVHIVVSENYSKEILNSKCVHAACDILEILNIPINDSTEQVFSRISKYINEYIDEYVKVNV